MRIRNILGAGAMLLGLTAYSAHAPAFAQTALTSPDSDALIAGYQLVQFDLAECYAIRPTTGLSANSNGVVAPDILQVANKICNDATAYQPKIKKLAKDKGFDLPHGLPYYLTARYAALVRNKGPGLGVRYLNDQISSHEDALAVFQDEAANGKDADLKALATEVIPTVQSNLDLLKATLAKHA